MIAETNDDPRWANGAPACFVGFGKSGVCHYRTYMPARALSASMYVRDDKTLAPIKELGVKEEPVVVYSMPYLDFQLAECAQALDAGQKLIVDVDDYLRGCMDNPHLVNPERFTEERVAMHEELLIQATLVTTSTEWIANKLRDTLGVKALVCPNAIDPDRFNVRKFPRNKQATIVGWSGSYGHLEALTPAMKGMEIVMRKRDDVAFVGMGQPHPDTFAAELLPEDLHSRCHEAGWMSVYDHAVAMCQVHIGLAPAADNDFYRAKSPIRFLEYGAAYVDPIVQSPTYDLAATEPEPNLDVLAPGADPEAWAAEIMLRISDPKERYRDGLKLAKYIKKNHTIDSSVPAWTEAINQALDA